MKGQKRFLFGVSTTTFVFAFAHFWTRKQEIACTQERHPADFLAIHNMLLVGEKTLYLSHLPMFQKGGLPMPHRYQAILEVTFAAGVTGNERRQHLRARFVIDATGRAAVVVRQQGAKRINTDRLVGLAGVLAPLSRVSACSGKECDASTLVEACAEGWW